MANKYEEKKVYYIPAYVEKIRELGKCPVKVSFRTGEERCAVDFENSPGLLFTAEEVAENVDTIARSTLDEYSEKAQRKIEALTKQLEEASETIKAFSESEDIVRTNFDAKVDENKELKSRNAELEALLKEVMATRDEAIRQNDELIAENEKLKAQNKRLDAENLRLRNKAIERTMDADNLMKENEGLKGDCNEWKDAVDKRIIDIQNLTAERDNLKADLTTQKEVNEELKAWYEEANKTASEAAEANDELKAKIADLRNRVGEQLAQIQDLNAEVHFLKEERDLKAKLAQEWHDNAHSTAKGLDELKGRYDELDSVNKEQAEKIRTLDKALIDLTAQPEEKAKSAHVVLNDGTEIEFRRNDIQVFYRTDIDILVINDGDEVIAGFDRGDNPTNFAYFFIG